MGGEAVVAGPGAGCGTKELVSATVEASGCSGPTMAISGAWLLASAIVPPRFQSIEVAPPQPDPTGHTAARAKSQGRNRAGPHPRSRQYACCFGAWRTRISAAGAIQVPVPPASGGPPTLAV